jgi:capsular polysaccharide biosynthesis protein
VRKLEADVSTDILIGVHGAGMTQLLFLPKHAAVIEVRWHRCFFSVFAHGEADVHPGNEC